MSGDLRTRTLRSVLQGDSGVACVVDVDGSVVAASPAFLNLGVMPDPVDLRAALQRARQRGQADLPGATLNGKITRLPSAPEEAPLFLFRASAPRLFADKRGGELQDALQKLLVHDLRSLLQSVSASLEPMLEAEGKAPDAEALRNGAKAAISASLRQISRVLSVVTGPVGAWLTPVPTDLDDILSELVTQITPIAVQRGVALRQISPGGGVVLSGPAVLLRELAQNMIDNAVKYGGGVVEVRMRQSLLAAGNWSVSLEVWQSGQGVTSVLLEQLRGGDPLHADVGPQSYGLRIMRLALQCLGGHWERETSAGRSCLRACFSLPEWAVQQAIEDSVPEEGADSVDLTGMTVLVVEDQQINRDWAVRALRRAGAHVLATGDAKAALTLLHAARPPVDMALLDITLPGGMDGIALARRIAQLSAPERPRAVIGLTGHGDRQTRDACRAAGMQGVLEKPILARDLLRYLSNLACEKEQPMPERRPETRGDQAQGALFDAEIVAELTEDLGSVGARDFMLKAISEAETTLEAVRSGGYSPQTRPLLHSAVGSSGITGLKRIEMALRSIQNAGGDSAGHPLACDALARAIGETRKALN
jgi:CheY-like chemotaxis protein